MLLCLVIFLNATAAAVAIWVALEVVLRATKHGNTFAGFNAFIAEVLEPKRAWLGFGLVAYSVLATTAAGTISLFPALVTP